MKKKTNWSKFTNETVPIKKLLFLMLFVLTISISKSQTINNYTSTKDSEKKLVLVEKTISNTNVKAYISTLTNCLNFNFNESDSYVLTFTNLENQKLTIKKITASNKHFEINISDLNNGNYTLEIQGKNNKTINKYEVFINN